MVNRVRILHRRSWQRGLKGIINYQSKIEKNVEEEKTRWRDMLSQRIKIDVFEEHEEGSEYLQRIEFECADIEMNAIESICFKNKANLEWTSYPHKKRPRVVVFASNESHALIEVLSRANDTTYEVPLIISNHQSLYPVAEQWKTPFVYLPRHGKQQEDDKRAIEEKEFALIEEAKADVIVLARYMQILSPHFCQLYQNRIINIHHSLLPSFRGARAHAQAYDRGVKLIGGTAHYVTEHLDDGPIIAQAAVPCDHRDSIADLRRKGQDAECLALSTALSAHIDHRVFVTEHRRRTVVFHGSSGSIKEEKRKR
mmetsp:Transcript_7653/g.11519  ORF Transcript_7653/g.11519 Transcript_7653/m.11519 type:complete len:312 (+) Transcript_7653:180-1115(+)